MAYTIMNVSPPTDAEIRQITIPVVENSEDVIFILTFTIQNVKKNPKSTTTTLEITMEVELNPDLQSDLVSNSSSPPDGGIAFEDSICKPFVITLEGYELSGEIEAIPLSPGNGQFDNDSKNFLFDLTVKKNGRIAADVEGLFALTDPNALSN